MPFIPNLEFKKALLDVHLHDEIKYCYQCNRCSDVCPVAAAAPGRYDPRILIMASFLGLPQLALNAEDNFMIWGCQVCDTCDEICPNHIELTEIFTLIKNIAVKLGKAPDYYTGQAKTILQYGKAIPMQPAIERRRQKMGLPPEPACDVEEIKSILKATNLDKKLKVDMEG
ncbi:MAG: 4Fe-4S dicluster domain-containing protein [Candidatus Helarchaeota archaeon]